MAIVATGQEASATLAVGIQPELPDVQSLRTTDVGTASATQKSTADGSQEMGVDASHAPPLANASLTEGERERTLTDEYVDVPMEWLPDVNVTSEPQPLVCPDKPP